MEKEKFSYSKINTYEGCPFKFKLRYVDKNFFSGDSLATEYGTLVHETEEAIGNAIRTNQQINYEELKNNFAIRAEELKNKYPNDYVAVDKSGRNYDDKTYFYLYHGIYRLENFMKEHPTYEIVGIEQALFFYFNKNFSMGI